MNLRRFSRQMKLPAVGSTGQAMIMSNTLVVPAGIESSCLETVRAYALGAGYAGVEEEHRPYPAATSELGLELRHAAARRVAEGAHLVFCSLHQLLMLSKEARTKSQS